LSIFFWTHGWAINAIFLAFSRFSDAPGAKHEVHQTY